MTATALRGVAVPLVAADGEVVGGCTATLVLVDPGAGTDPEAWAITHQLGTPAGGTHTEVALVDGTLARVVPTEHRVERVADDLVRQVANALYGNRWAFHYRPEQVPGRVLAHGSRLRERVEVTEVELWV